MEKFQIYLIQIKVALVAETANLGYLISKRTLPFLLGRVLFLYFYLLFKNGAFYFILQLLNKKRIHYPHLHDFLPVYYYRAV